MNDRNRQRYAKLRAVVAGTDVTFSVRRQGQDKMLFCICDFCIARFEFHLAAGRAMPEKFDLMSPAAGNMIGDLNSLFRSESP